MGDNTVAERIWISDRRNSQGYGEYTEVPNCEADIEYRRVTPAVSTATELDLAPIEARRAKLSQVGYSGSLNNADFAFTVNAPSDIDSLIAEVKRQREIITALKAVEGE